MRKEYIAPVSKEHSVNVQNALMQTSKPFVDGEDVDEANTKQEKQGTGIWDLY